jgi:hypothetical protein
MIRIAPNLRARRDDHVTNRVPGGATKKFFAQPSRIFVARAKALA